MFWILWGGGLPFVRPSVRPFTICQIKDRKSVYLILMPHSIYWAPWRNHWIWEARTYKVHFLEELSVHQKFMSSSVSKVSRLVTCPISDGHICNLICLDISTYSLPPHETCNNWLTLFHVIYWKVTALICTSWYNQREAHSAIPLFPPFSLPPATAYVCIWSSSDVLLRHRIQLMYVSSARAAHLKVLCDHKADWRWAAQGTKK